MTETIEERREDFERRYDAFVASHSAFCAELRELREEGKEIEDAVLTMTARDYIEEKEELEKGKKENGQ